MSYFIDIDGGMLEGGGQLLRMAVALSTLSSSPIRVHNIRAGRSSPGLRAQHLKGMEIVKQMCRGKLKGAEIGSTSIEYHPGRMQGGEYYADTQTAGSIGLIMQVALPIALFADDVTFLKLKGGTNAEMAPQFDYTTEIFRPLLEKFGATFDYKIIKRGYFPRGGGEVQIRVRPIQKIRPVEMIESGRVVDIWGWAFVAGALPIKMAESMVDGATSKLRESFPGVEINLVPYKEAPEEAVGSGSGIIIIAETEKGCLLGGSALGKRELKPEDVGQKAVDDLLQSINTGACVDHYAQDQVIWLMAVACGKSRLKCGPITLHTRTAIHIAEMLTEATFNIVKLGPDSNILECDGTGLNRINVV